jgi:maleylacetate reductase
MRSFVYESLPGRVVFGEGAVDQVAAEIAELGDPQRVVVVASGSGKATGDRIGVALGGRFAVSLGEVRQHVPEELADAARSAARAASADAVVTVGGGSAIGLGKVMAVALDVPLVAVPTTYSGSEMTPVYGVTAGSKKRTQRDLRALPRLVVYDPVLTVGLPTPLGVTSGFNALAHCVEALWIPRSSPMVGLWAKEGIRVLIAGLPRIVTDPGDLEARSDVLYGAYLAGATLAGAGTALHHKLCHVLGGAFGLDHAGVHTVLLPHVVAFNASAVPQSMAWLAGVLGGPSAPEAAGGMLYDLASRLGAPTNLEALGMPADEIDEAAAQAAAAVGATNPRPIDRQSLRELLRAALEGGRP